MGPHDRTHSSAERRNGLAAAGARSRRRKGKHSALLDAPEASIRSEAFNIGTDEQNYLVRQLAEVLASVTGCAIEIAEGSSADQRSYRVDFSKIARTFPDLEFEWDAERGARELVEAYRQVGLTTEDFDGDRYIRIRRLMSLWDQGTLDAELRWRSPVAP